MKPTLQQTTIGTHLQTSRGHRINWPFNSASEIAEQLCKKGLSLRQGEYLVVSLSGTEPQIEKATNLEDLAGVPGTSLVIPYHELERGFHEQHAEWIEQ